MFDTKKVPATPAWARRLCRLQKLNGMQLSPRVLELASTGLIEGDSLAGTGLQLDEASLRALQHVADWNGRALLLDDSDHRGRNVAMAHVALKQCNKVVILTKPQLYGVWASMIKSIWPQDSVSVFGNPRYQYKDAIYPEGVHFSETADYDARWVITSYGSFLYNNMLSRFIPDQLIVDELDNNVSVNYRWMDAVKGIFLEVPNTLIINNLEGLETMDRGDALTNLQTCGTTANAHLNSLVVNFLIPGCGTMDILNLPAQTSLSEYLQTRGYTGMSYFNILGLMGANVDLIMSEGGSRRPLLYHSSSFDGFGKNVNKKLFEIEERIEQRTGSDLMELLRKHVDGEFVNTLLIHELQSQSWANSKAQFINHICGQLGGRMTRSLIVASHPELYRRIKFVLSCEDLSNSLNRDISMARYLHPNPLWQKYARGDIPPPVNRLLVKSLEEVNEDILASTDYLVLAEWPTDRELYDLTCELATASNIRVVHTALTGTFEEKLEKLLLKSK